MMPGAMTTDATAAKEALLRFATAYGFFLAGLCTLTAHSEQLAAGSYFSGPVVAGVHLLTLGWISISIFAALRVFSGVALGSNLEAPKLGLVQWISWSLGVVSFPLGLAFSYAPAIVVGLVALLVGLVTFSIIAIPVYRKANRGFLTRKYLYVALASLWVVFTIGSIAGLRRAGIVLPHPPAYLQAHLLAAIFGWAGSTVVGVGSHVLPMFALSAKPPEKPAIYAFPFFAAIPILALVGAFFPWPFIELGWASACIGTLLWTVQAFHYARTRMRKEFESGLSLAALATGLMLLGWPTLIALERSMVSIEFFVVGWLSLFTLGIYHRVVPFLVWFQRFSKQIGRKRIPKVGDITDPLLGWFTAWVSFAGALLWGIGLATASTALTMLGGLLVTIAGFSAGFQLFPLYQTTAPGAPPAWLKEKR